MSGWSAWTCRCVDGVGGVQRDPQRRRGIRPRAARGARAQEPTARAPGAGRKRRRAASGAAAGAGRGAASARAGGVRWLAGRCRPAALQRRALPSGRTGRARSIRPHGRRRRAPSRQSARCSAARHAAAGAASRRRGRDPAGPARADSAAPSRPAAAASAAGASRRGHADVGHGGKGRLRGASPRTHPARAAGRQEGSRNGRARR